MSAWMVTDAHVDLLATAYVALVDHAADPQAIGQQMLMDNARSLEARYPGNGDGNEEQAESYVYRRWLGNIDPDLLSTEIACLDYQSCEFEEWPQSPSRAYLDALQAHCDPYEIVAKRNDSPDGRRLAPWGIDWHPEDAPAPEDHPRHYVPLVALPAAAQIEFYL